MLKWWNRQQLYFRVLVGITIGLIVGFTFGESAQWLMKPIGTAFLRLLFFLVTPLTLFTLVSGITKMESAKSLASMGGKLILYYAITSVIAVFMSFAISLAINPGAEGAGLLGGAAAGEKAEFSFIENAIKWIPTNPFEALATGNILQVVFFSVFLGCVLLILGERAKTVTKLFDEGCEIMLTITGYIMSLAPYGIMGLTSDMVSSLSGKMFAEVGKFLLADWVSILAVVFILYPIQLKVLANINPIKFFKAITPAMLIAASTTSSSAALPVSLDVAAKNLRISESIYGFGLTVGSTINSNGMTCVLAAICVFAANLYGMTLTLPMILQFGILAVMLSMGTGGVKGGGIVLSTVLLQSMGLPLELVPILAAIWPIGDIAHTSGNVVGDLVGVTIISARENDMDVEGFNHNFVSERV